MFFHSDVLSLQLAIEVLTVVEGIPFVDYDTVRGPVLLACEILMNYTNIPADIICEGVCDNYGPVVSYWNVYVLNCKSLL